MINPQKSLRIQKMKIKDLDIKEFKVFQTIKTIL